MGNHFISEEDPIIIYVIILVAGCQNYVSISFLQNIIDYELQFLHI